MILMNQKKIKAARILLALIIYFKRDTGLLLPISYKIPWREFVLHDEGGCQYLCLSPFDI